jgi:hypothetical protein
MATYSGTSRNAATGQAAEVDQLEDVDQWLASHASWLPKWLPSLQQMFSSPAGFDYTDIFTQSCNHLLKDIDTMPQILKQALCHDDGALRALKDNDSLRGLVMDGDVHRFFLECCGKHQNIGRSVKPLLIILLPSTKVPR